MKTIQNQLMLYKSRSKLALHRTLSTLKWIILSLIEGAILGVLGTAFYYCVTFVTGLRQSHIEITYLLPVGSLLILYVYHLTKRDTPGGTNLVLSSIREDKDVPLRMTPLIFFSTVFSHLCGASVGREGAALQLGGSIGVNMAKFFHQRGGDRKIMIITGMGAAFSALLGTPLTGAVFALEITSVGVMYYPALLPSVIAALTAHQVALLLHQPVVHYSIGEIPDFGFLTGLQIGVVGIVSGAVAILFILSLRLVEKESGHCLHNKYIRGLILGTILLGLTLITNVLEGTPQQYNGAGIDMINLAIRGNSPWYAFLVKILFTALSIAAGYKGGEIVPSFFIGATLGCAIAPLIGLSPALCAAAGMGAVFCGVTNCPMAGLLFLFELFGFEAMPYFLLAIAISYVVSSYVTLYKTQHFHFAKFKGDDPLQHGGR